MRYTVKTFLNEVRGHRFTKYQGGDAVANGPELEVEVSMVDPEGLTKGLHDMLMEALDKVWQVGNREDEAVFHDGTTRWPRTVRSLSAGDLLVVAGHGAYSIESVGFAPVGKYALVQSLLSNDTEPEDSLFRQWKAASLVKSGS